MDIISWKLIDTYFNENPNNLVRHHLDSYNDFFSRGINNIFRENNPIRFIERDELKLAQSQKEQQVNEFLLYLGGKDGSKIYFGKPIIYDDNMNHVHYMYPNDARLRNMWYGTTIHYDVEVDVIYYLDDVKIEKSFTLEKIYLGKFPIMVQSNLCILKSLSTEVRFNMGECKNDVGGYFIIAGKEKVILPQETFADNMIYIRKNKSDHIYSHFAEIRSVSEDTSKPKRKTTVSIINPSISFTNNQIVVSVPNVRKAVPLFILMRALGVISDKDIIKTCLLDIEKNKNYVNLFVPSVHDANRIFNQESAILFIATFTKRKTISSVIEILSNYFLPHVGELNFIDKAYFIGFMVFKLLKVYTTENTPTDRDNFKFKRIELSGTLIYDLFREYYLIQKRAIGLKIDKEFYFHKGKYKGVDFENLVSLNSSAFFKDRDVENGFMKAFKGNWGSESYTKRVGVVQDLNRLSWNSFMSHLRKINLPLDPTSKVIGPRLLNSSQWGYIDPVDSPDGGNIGLHKHLSIFTVITCGTSCHPIIKWLRANTSMKTVMECSPEYLSSSTKLFVNGIWTGVIDIPVELVSMMKLFRRNGLIPLFTSINFNRTDNEIHIYTDAGRLTRPIYYMSNGEPSFKQGIDEKINWENYVSGFNVKADETYSHNNNKLYELSELYPDMKNHELLHKNRSIVDYIDTNEEDGSLIAMTETDIPNNKNYTHIEIDPSLILGVMGNQIIYPENNPIARNVFSCGQSRQAVSVYNSNYQLRIDKMGVILNSGQIPLIKSKYLDYINKEQQPYGVNAIVAIMSYTGYNVEDAILINEGSINRGIFRTTYYSMYETHEESSKTGNSKSDSRFADIEKHNVIGIKPGYDYSLLDDNGLIKENTQLNDKTVVIGKMTTNPEDKSVYSDSSIFPKKGQLGVVDKSFITEGETGTKLAKVRIREERIPAIGDKMASRAGQKGTLGLIIPEQDMPFTSDGIRPDLIINPHAIPSRMTIGQLIETLFGKACCMYGGFGDCTAFSIKGPNTKLYGEMLTNVGFHSSGNQILYDGMSGDQIQSDIFIGPTYYMRLKHMVKDKINARALGPRTVLTHQTVQGRANDGGLRIGEMERDGILAHGASYFLNESYLIRGDEYYMAVCNKSGLIAVYNASRNIFLSPAVDGPIKFHTNPDGSKNVESISRYGRSFSIVRIPYALKLLIQELQVLNVQMRIITDENIDQLMSMSYSDNYKLLLKSEESTDVDKNIQKYTSNINTGLRKSRTGPKIPTYEPDTLSVTPENETPDYAPYSPAYEPPETPDYAPYSPAYEPPETPVDKPKPVPAPYIIEPGIYTYKPEPKENEILPSSIREIPQSNGSIDFGSNELNTFFKTIKPKIQNSIIEMKNKNDQLFMVKRLYLKSTQKKDDVDNILKVDEEVIPVETENEPSLGEVKVVNI